MEQYYAAQLMEDLDDDQGAVLARVQTTARAGEALHWARRTVTALLDIAMSSDAPTAGPLPTGTC